MFQNCGPLSLNIIVNPHMGLSPLWTLFFNFAFDLGVVDSPNEKMASIGIH
jgi:hypothetical protein